MPRSGAFRLLTSFFGMWFMFTLVQPNGMMGLAMGGSMGMAGGASMSMLLAPMPMHLATAAPAAAPLPEGTSMTSHNHAAADMEMPVSAARAADTSLTPGSSTPPLAPAQCDQHDCCCSALTTVSLTPVATLAWLPEHVIDQNPPHRGEYVVHADGQVVLPPANGPPRTVSARA